MVVGTAKGQAIELAGWSQDVLYRTHGHPCSCALAKQHPAAWEMAVLGIMSSPCSLYCTSTVPTDASDVVDRSELCV